MRLIDTWNFGHYDKNEEYELILQNHDLTAWGKSLSWNKSIFHNLISIQDSSA